jgi:hypothetical protein
VSAGLFSSLTSSSIRGPGEEPAEIKRERINLFPKEAQLQLADSFISLGLPNIPFI